MENNKIRMRIDVKTPRKQAAKAMQTQKDALLGFKGKKKVVHEKLIADNHFYWVLECEPKDIKGITAKAAKGEIVIKKFYKILFKTIDRVNKLQAKFKRGFKWVKKQLIKRMRKLTENDNNDGFINELESMPDDELNGFIKINDRKEMDKLLSGDLITVKELDNGAVY